jgi:chromosome segregation ATPase
MASVIVAVGLVSAPEIPEQVLLVEQPKEENVEVIDAKVDKVEEIKQNTEKEEFDEEIKILNQEIQNLKNQKTREENARKESLINEIRELESQIGKYGGATPILETVDGETEIEQMKRQKDLYLAAVKEAEQEYQRKIIEGRNRQMEQELNLLESELQKQREPIQEIVNEYPNIEEKNLQDEILLSQIKSDVSYLSGQINLLNREVEQLINFYRSDIDGEQARFQNGVESYQSLYEPEMQRLHREILNEASKGIWTDCTLLRSFWDSQNGMYQQYTTDMNAHKIRFDINTNSITSSYRTDLRFYSQEIQRGRDLLNQYLNKLNPLSVSGVNSLKNEVENLISQLNEIEVKINSNQSYNVSISDISSILSIVDSWIQEEKEWFAKTSCQNLP